MKYENIYKGQFESRPNRFIAYVDICGKREKVHVKNTGRCRELLTDKAEVYLEKSRNPSRSTAYDLVAVRKGQRLVNMDSQAPNKAVEEWLCQGGLFPDVVKVRPETVHGNSRFDFYVETPGDRIFIEVKGVTLEQEDVVLFPDAPSERAVKHVNELSEAVGQGYKACIIFVIQMKGVKYFTPNRQTQPEFADALIRAREAGVEILAYDCHVTEDSMSIHEPVPVRLSVLDEIAKPLLAWYDNGRRILPWREEPTPYHVWVSEIMLQQTRVEAVKPYYERFLKELPTISSLARASEGQILKLWEGLGYYNRVRNMQKAAQAIVAEYGGGMPGDFEKIRALPGIGSYTAGAIASIAFGIAKPAVDGNVLRVLSRLTADDGDILKQSVKRRMEEQVEKVIPKERPGDFNQSLIELGALVCVPGGLPRCEECPLSHLCAAKDKGIQTEFPKKSPKKERRRENRTVLALVSDNKAILHKRPEKGLLAGLYELPNLEGTLTEEQVLEYVKGQRLSPIRIRRLAEAKHIFSHIEWHMLGYLVQIEEPEMTPGAFPAEGLLFVEREEMDRQYSIPSAFGAYVKYLKEIL